MKLNYKRTILIGFAFMAILAFWQFYDQVIPYLLEVKFGRDVLESKIFLYGGANCNTYTFGLDY